MKIMALGDSHCDAKYVIHALSVAYDNDCDVVYVVGDFGYWEHTDYGKRFLDDVDNASRELDVPVWFCDGNHESFDMLYSIPVSDDGLRYVRRNIIHTPRGHIWQWDSMNFMAMGGAHSIDGPGGIWRQTRGPNQGSWWPQETIKEHEVDQAIENINGRNIDVLFAHDVPYEVSIPGITGYPMSDENRKRLSRVTQAANPMLIVSGHYHKYYNGIAEWYSDYGWRQAQQIILAHNHAYSGQYVFINTDEDEEFLEVPEWPKQEVRFHDSNARLIL